MSIGIRERVRLLPYNRIGHEGAVSWLVTFESVTGVARVMSVARTDTLEVSPLGR